MTGLVPVVGIDPGGRSTGVVVRIGDRLTGAWIIERHRSSPISDHGDGLAAWETDCLTVLAEAIVAAANSTSALKMFPDAVEHTALYLVASGAVAVAVEQVRKPNPHQRRADGNSLTNIDGILATASLVGAIRTAFPGTVGVEPGGNGSHVLDAYPRAIRSAGNATRRGPAADRWRHARSAWDVAGVARFLLAARRSAPPPPRIGAGVHTIGPPPNPRR